MRRAFTAHDESPRGDTEPAATLLYAPVPVVKGRGTVWALEHRFNSLNHEAWDDGWQHLRAAAEDDAPAPPPATEVSHETVRSIVSANDSPDIGFDLSINPYRGCEHGCIFREGFIGSRVHRFQSANPL